jgi:toxin CptA
LSQGWAFDFQPLPLPGPRGRRPCSIFSVAMSIAVSAVIVPSRLLGFALALFVAANLGAAAALGSGLAGQFLLPQAGACGCLLAAVVLAASLARGQKVRRIDISGLGQLRLTVQQGIGSNETRTDLADLLRGSTVWPGLMLLRLRRADGVVGAVALLPDSVEPGQFRRLSVAIRDIAARKK